MVFSTPQAGALRAPRPEHQQQQNQVEYVDRAVAVDVPEADRRAWALLGHPSHDDQSRG